MIYCFYISYFEIRIFSAEKIKDRLIERILYYWSRIYGKNLKEGDDYVELKRTIEVLIVNFEIKRLRRLKYHSKWKIIEEEDRNVILTEHLELHIIELPKIYRIRKKEEEQELVKWLNFIENPESKKVGEYMKENKEMKEAKERLEIMSEDERMQILAELRLKAIRDEKAVERFGYNKGIEKGIKQGKKGEKKEMARKMKEKGVKIPFIQEITGLTIEEIELL